MPLQDPFAPPIRDGKAENWPVRSQIVVRKLPTHGEGPPCSIRLPLLLLLFIAVPLPVPKAGWWWSFAPPLPQPQLSVLQSHRPPRALAVRPVGGGSALADWLEWCKKPSQAGNGFGRTAKGEEHKQMSLPNPRRLKHRGQPDRAIPASCCCTDEGSCFFPGQRPHRLGPCGGSRRTGSFRHPPSFSPSFLTTRRSLIVRRPRPSATAGRFPAAHCPFAPHSACPCPPPFPWRSASPIPATICLQPHPSVPAHLPLEKSSVVAECFAPNGPFRDTFGLLALLMLVGPIRLHYRISSHPITIWPILNSGVPSTHLSKKGHRILKFEQNLCHQSEIIPDYSAFDCVFIPRGTKRSPKDQSRRFVVSFSLVVCFRPQPGSRQERCWWLAERANGCCTTASSPVPCSAGARPWRGKGGSAGGRGWRKAAGQGQFSAAVRLSTRPASRPTRCRGRTGKLAGAAQWAPRQKAKKGSGPWRRRHGMIGRRLPMSGKHIPTSLKPLGEGTARDRPKAARRREHGPTNPSVPARHGGPSHFGNNERRRRRWSSGQFAFAPSDVPAAASPASSLDWRGTAIGGRCAPTGEMTAAASVGGEQTIHPVFPATFPCPCCYWSSRTVGQVLLPRRRSPPFFLPTTPSPSPVIPGATNGGDDGGERRCPCAAAAGGVLPPPYSPHSHQSPKCSSSPSPSSGGPAHSILFAHSPDGRSSHSRSRGPGQGGPSLSQQPKHPSLQKWPNDPFWPTIWEGFPCLPSSQFPSSSFALFPSPHSFACHSRD